MHELAARGGRVVVQGRDEARGCFIPEPRCRELQEVVSAERAAVCARFVFMLLDGNECH